MSDVMRRYLSINRKGLCPKSYQLNSELSQLCLCFNLDHSALSCGLKSHQEDIGTPLEMALTFSFFLWGLQLQQKEQGEFSGQLTPCSGLMEVMQVTLCLLLSAGAVPSQSLSCWVCVQHSFTCHTQGICDFSITSFLLVKNKGLQPAAEQQRTLQKGNAWKAPMAN